MEAELNLILVSGLDCEFGGSFLCEEAMAVAEIGTAS
jgi:hypothetical protein